MKRVREKIVDRRHDRLRKQISEEFRSGAGRDECSFLSLGATQNVLGQLKVHLDDPQGFALLVEVGADLRGARILEEVSHHVVRAQYRGYTWKAVGMCTTPQLSSRHLNSANAGLQRRTTIAIADAYFDSVRWSTQTSA